MISSHVLPLPDRQRAVMTSTLEHMKLRVLLARPLLPRNDFATGHLYDAHGGTVRVCSTSAFL